MDNGVKSSRQGTTHHIVELKIPVPWGHIAVKAWNDPCGTPVIALHGTQDNAGTFNRLIPLLPSTYYYVCVDMPGHGLSSHLAPGMALDFLDYVTVISRVALYFQWEKFILMGHSLGAHIISFYAGLYPRNVQKLIMLDAVSPFGIPMPLYFDTIRSVTDNVIELEELKSAPPSYTYEEIVDRVMTKRVSRISEDGAKELIDRGFVQSGNGFSFSGDRRMRMSLAPLLTVDQILDVLKRIHCPQLLIITKFIRRRMDVEVIKRALALYKTRRNFTYEYVDGEHDIHNESPEVIAPIIIKFLLRRKSGL